MLAWAAWAHALVAAATSCSGARNCMFFSEVFDGAPLSYRYVEVVNLCDSVQATREYMLRIWHADGETSALQNDFEVNPGETFAYFAGERGTIANDAFRISYRVTALVDQDGSGAMTERYALMRDSVVIDMIGPSDSAADMANGITVAGVGDALTNAKAVRKAMVTHGNCGDWARSAGVDQASSEWLLFPSDAADVDETLGGHQTAGPPSPPPAPPLPPSPAGGRCYGGCLFFSEYYEGELDEDAYFEVFNACDEPIELQRVEIKYCVSPGCAANRWANRRDLGAGTLAPGHTYLVAGFGARSQILALADAVWSDLPDGDDALSLWWKHGDVLVDQIGRTGVWDQAAWDVAGVSGGARDHRLVRKPSVSWGNCGGWSSSAGTTSDNSEWYVWGTAELTALGHHECEGCPTPAVPSAGGEGEGGSSADGGGGGSGDDDDDGDDDDSSAPGTADAPALVAPAGQLTLILVSSALSVLVSLVLTCACCYLNRRCPWYKLRQVKQNTVSATIVTEPTLEGVEVRREPARAFSAGPQRRLTRTGAAPARLACAQIAALPIAAVPTAVGAEAGFSPNYDARPISAARDPSAGPTTAPLRWPPEPSPAPGPVGAAAHEPAAAAAWSERTAAYVPTASVVEAPARPLAEPNPFWMDDNPFHLDASGPPGSAGPLSHGQGQAQLQHRRPHGPQTETQAQRPGDAAVGIAAVEGARDAIVVANATPNSGGMLELSV